jgi:hypothetical protein
MTRALIAILALQPLHLSAAPPEPPPPPEYRVVAIAGRFAAYVGPQPLVLSSKLREKKPATYEDAIIAFGPAFTHQLSSSGSWEWHFDDGKSYRVIGNWSGPLSTSITLKLLDAPPPPSPPKSPTPPPR